MEKTAVRLDVPFSEKVSRLFIFRPLWAIVLIFPLIPAGIIMYVICCLQFLYMLFLGKRHKGMWDQTIRFFSWMTQWQSYLNAYTDMRPGFWY